MLYRDKVTGRAKKLPRMNARKNYIVAICFGSGLLLLLYKLFCIIDMLFYTSAPHTHTHTQLIRSRHEEKCTC